MGNAIRNPGRFFEKKVAHEIFGAHDPRASEKDRQIWEKCNEKHINIIENMQKNTHLTKGQRAQHHADFATHTHLVNKCFRDAHK